MSFLHRLIILAVLGLLIGVILADMGIALGQSNTTDCQISWDANPVEEEVTSYKGIFEGTQTGDTGYITGTSILSSAYGIVCPDSTTTFKVLAHNAAGDGEASDPVPLLPLPSKAGGVSVLKVAP